MVVHDNPSVDERVTVVPEATKTNCPPPNLIACQFAVSGKVCADHVYPSVDVAYESVPFAIATNILLP